MYNSPDKLMSSFLIFISILSTILRIRAEKCSINTENVLLDFVWMSRFTATDPHDFSGILTGHVPSLLHKIKSTYPHARAGVAFWGEVASHYSMYTFDSPDAVYATPNGGCYKPFVNLTESAEEIQHKLSGLRRDSAADNAEQEALLGLGLCAVDSNLGWRLEGKIDYVVVKVIAFAADAESAYPTPEQDLTSDCINQLNATTVGRILKKKQIYLSGFLEETDHRGDIYIDYVESAWKQYYQAFKIEGVNSNLSSKKIRDWTAQNYTDVVMEDIKDAICARIENVNIDNKKTVSRAGKPPYFEKVSDQSTLLNPGVQTNTASTNTFLPSTSKPAVSASTSKVTSSFEVSNETKLPDLSDAAHTSSTPEPTKIPTSPWITTFDTTFSKLSTSDTTTTGTPSMSLHERKPCKVAGQPKLPPTRLKLKFTFNSNSN